MKQKIPFILSVFTATLLIIVSICQARPNATTKYSVIREENPKMHQETLILPYAFPSESLGTTYGVGGLVKGFLQDQLLFGGAAFGSSDDAYGFVGGMWDYRLPYTERLFFSAVGSYGHYPRQRAYAEVPRRPSDFLPPPPGSNDSDKDDYVESEGDDNWLDLKLEYVLPIGSQQDSALGEYHLQNGILKSGASGGDVWNPLESGVSVLLLGHTSRYQSYIVGGQEYDGDTFPVELGFLYNNTDFPVNPSKGSFQYLSYSQDFGDSVVGSWSFLQFEASKYFDLGASDYSRQRVVALNLWTATSPSWEEELQPDGTLAIANKPPFFEGARLGGFYRMRAYPNNRFNDRSVIYTSAEYRYTLDWNPIAGVSWLRWLKADWFQLVGFIEGGQVAANYDFSELFDDWKVDGGVGIRAMMAGAVVRFDMAASDEGATAWVMFGHPF